MNYGIGFICAGLGVALVAAWAGSGIPARDVAKDALAAEHARVDALLRQDWDAVRRIAHPDFQHQESNGQMRNIDDFVAAMRWCGTDGKTPGKPEDMPKGGGFSFAEHTIDWRTVSVFVLPDTENAIVTGKYTNVLRRCFKRDDGTTGVEEPTSPKPAAFTRYYTNGQLRWHRALVDSAAPASAMSVNFPPNK